MPPTTDAHELSLELTTQELLALPESAGMVEIDNICDVDPALSTGAFAANADWARIEVGDGSIEIELSATEMDELLSAATQP